MWNIIKPSIESQQMCKIKEINFRKDSWTILFGQSIVLISRIWWIYGEYRSFWWNFGCILHSHWHRTHFGFQLTLSLGFNSNKSGDAVYKYDTKVSVVFCQTRLRNPDSSSRIETNIWCCRSVRSATIKCNNFVKLRQYNSMILVLESST